MSNHILEDETQAQVHLFLHPGAAVNPGGFDLSEIAVPEPWVSEAICAQVDTGDVFFPEKGGSTREAKKICSLCTVREECLEYALTHGERYGIWGGMSERDRRQIARKRKIA